MAAPSADTLFESAVTKILKSWTVLQLAVNHGFGGAHSQEKGEWMVTAVCQWFKENDEIEPYELEDFLSDVLNTEFDTIAEDGSLQQIAAMVCKMYSLCISGQTSEVTDRLKLLPSPQVQLCVAGPTEGEEEETLCNGGEAGPSTSRENTQNMNQTGADNSPCEEAMDTDDNKDALEDGWTVVRKGKKR